MLSVNPAMESSLDPRDTDLQGDLQVYLWTLETLMSKLAGDDSFPEIKATLVRDLSTLIYIKILYLHPNQLLK